MDPLSGSLFRLPVETIIQAVSPIAERFLIGLYQMLSYTDSPIESDLTFAMAGRNTRKICAIELMSAGRTQHLLLSVGRFEIRGFKDLPLPVLVDLPHLAAAIPPNNRHFLVHFADGTAESTLIAKGYLGTLAEIRALQAWLKVHTGVRSVQIVSSATHLRRVRLCCRTLLPTSIQVRFVAVPDGPDYLRNDSWWRSTETRSIVLSEFPKLVLYWVVLHLQSAASKIGALSPAASASVFHERKSTL